MKHEEDCRWEMTTLEECGYRQTHHYCPHPEHACSCVKVPVSDHEPYGTCDWGDCNEEAVRWRYGDQEHGHLPVCYEHSLEAENTRLREQAEALSEALEAIIADGPICSAEDAELCHFCEGTDAHGHAGGCAWVLGQAALRAYREAKP